MTTSLKGTIPATEVRTIKARNVNQEYRISVALPCSYLSKPRKRYPIIYLVDANWYFGMVTEWTRVMPRCQQFPETIVVGIGYPVDEPLEAAWKQHEALRDRDFTPVVDRNVERMEAKDLKPYHVSTGGAGKFLQFIKAELIPIIEMHYRAIPAERILAGHSYGGLFVLYALFHQPKLFKGYVACSPSLHFGDRVTFKHENQFAKTHRTLPVRLYLGMGDQEETPERPYVSNMLQFAARLESRKYKGLSVTKQIVDNCGHCASTAPTFQAGLQAVLS